MAKDLRHIREGIKARHPNNRIARYREYLLELSGHFPDLWERLSEVSLSDRRKIVAKTPQELFVSSPHLIKEYAYPIVPGWYLDINLKVEGMKQRLEIAEKIYRENTDSDSVALRP